MKINQSQLLSVVNNRKTIMNQIQKSFAKISSGSRITGAADSPHGVTKMKGLETRLRTLNQRQNGIQDKISFLQVKDSALDNMTAMVQRVRELTVQESHGTLSGDDKAIIHREIEQLKEGLSDIYHQTEFNDMKVFKNFGQPEQLTKSIDMSQVFIGDYDDVMSKVDKIIFRDLDTTLVNYFSNSEGGNLDEIDDVLKTLSSERMVVGAMQFGLESYSRFLDVHSENLTNQKSSMFDLDIAKEKIILTKAQLLEQSTMMSMLHIQENNERVLDLLKWS